MHDVERQCLVDELDEITTKLMNLMKDFFHGDGYSISPTGQVSSLKLHHATKQDTRPECLDEEFLSAEHGSALHTKRRLIFSKNYVDKDALK